MFTSAVAIFSGGTSLRWVRDQLCRDVTDRAEAEGADPYERMTALAEQSPIGARKLLFNPSMAGGSSLEPSPHLRGAFVGLDLGHTRADVIRATLEGIAMNLRLALDELRRLAKVADEMIVLGGASRSPLWRQILADAFEIDILKTNVGQDAGSLGAAAIAAVACGLWRDFSRIHQVHRIESVSHPEPNNVQVYRRLLPVFGQLRAELGRIGEVMVSLP
jgi:xylulokinase